MLGVARLAMRVHAVVRGAHSKRTAAFAWLTPSSRSRASTRRGLNLLCPGGAHLPAGPDGRLHQGAVSSPPTPTPTAMAARSRSSGCSRRCARSSSSSPARPRPLLPRHRPAQRDPVGAVALARLGAHPVRSRALAVCDVRAAAVALPRRRRRLEDGPRRPSAQIVASALKGIEAGDGGDMNARRHLAGAALVSTSPSIDAGGRRLYAIAANDSVDVRRVAGLSHKGKAYERRARSRADIGDQRLRTAQELLLSARPATTA